MLAICAVMFTSCTSQNDFDKGKQQLEQQGYTNVENTGYSMLCCSHDDQFSTGFKCLNSKGEIVEGCFYSHVFKGITVRFN